MGKSRCEGVSSPPLARQAKRTAESLKTNSHRKEPHRPSLSEESSGQAHNRRNDALIGASK